MTPDRLQQFLRDSVARRSHAIVCGPYTAYVNHADPLPYLNYAIPVDGARPDELAATLPALEALFQAHERTPRFEFVEAAVPEFTILLHRAAYAAEAPAYAMTCTAATLTIPAAAAHVELVPETAPDEDLRALMHVRAAAFGNPAPPGAALAELRANLTTTVRAVARERGTIVGVASRSSIHHGIAEISGVGVLERMRRRGYGAALTAVLSANAFANGAATTFLTAGSREAESVYTRIGYTPYPHAVLAYTKQMSS